MIESSEDQFDNEAFIKDFIDTIRQTFRKLGKKPRGSFLPSKKLTAIGNAAAEICADPSVSGITYNDAFNLLERFEEMCRRLGRSKSITNIMRPDIMRCLASELKSNHEAFGGSPSKLISFTLINGAIGQRLIEEFPLFAGSLWIFRRVAADYPSDPQKFLRGAVQAISDLTEESKKKDSEFARFAGMPGIFRYAAIHNSPDPKKYLREVISGKAHYPGCKRPKFDIVNKNNPHQLK
jgi:hypothetical protein